MKGIAFAIAVVACATHAFAQSGSKPAAKTVEPKLTLGKPVQIGALAVVPILAQDPLSPDQYTVLADATRFGWVKIHEIPGNEEVNFLEVTNTGKLPLMLFAGELLLGGKQDRIVGRDTIVPSGKTVKVPVFCVEHGRWQGDSSGFRGGDTFVPANVRDAAVASKDQSKVWNEVEKSNNYADASPVTGTIRGALGDPKVKKSVDALTTKLFAQMPKSNKVVGMVCWMNGKIQSADVFANHKLYSGACDKLLRSYAADLALTKKPTAKPVDLRKCADFLAEIVSAKRQLDEKSLYGNTYRVKNGKIEGYESGSRDYVGMPAMSRGGAGAGGAGFGHGSYKPGKGGG